MNPADYFSLTVAELDDEIDALDTDVSSATAALSSLDEQRPRGRHHLELKQIAEQVRSGVLALRSIFEMRGAADAAHAAAVSSSEASRIRMDTGALDAMRALLVAKVHGAVIDAKGLRIELVSEWARTQVHGVAPGLDGAMTDEKLHRIAAVLGQVAYLESLREIEPETLAA